MQLKQLAYRILPDTIRRAFVAVREQYSINRVERQSCDISKLSDRKIVFDEIFSNKELNDRWLVASAKTDLLSLPEGAGGINLGDRRALFFLINFLQPAAVLEVGTHIGASTLYIGLALDACLNRNLSEKSCLTTVDICDVNDPSLQLWERFGSPASPRDLLKAVELDQYVRFITDHSIDYMTKTEDSFDFIFLDGDHRAATVYREIPIALQRLRPDGFILLHDYFPNGEPLKRNWPVVPGPYLAVERLRKEGIAIAALPLGELPWPTKLGSHKTSLALLYRTNTRSRPV